MYVGVPLPVLDHSGKGLAKKTCLSTTVVVGSLRALCWASSLAITVLTEHMTSLSLLEGI